MKYLLDWIVAFVVVFVGLVLIVGACFLVGSALQAWGPLWTLAAFAAGLAGLIASLFVIDRIAGRA